MPIFSLLVSYPPLLYCLPVSLTRTFSPLSIHLCLRDSSLCYVLSLCLSLILLYIPSLQHSSSLHVYPPASLPYLYTHCPFNCPSLDLRLYPGLSSVLLLFSHPFCSSLHLRQFPPLVFCPVLTSPWLISPPPSVSSACLLSSFCPHVPPSAAFRASQYPGQLRKARAFFGSLAAEGCAATRKHTFPLNSGKM